MREKGIHSAHTPVLEDSDWLWFQQYYASPRKAKKDVYKWLAYRLFSSTNDIVHIRLMLFIYRNLNHFQNVGARLGVNQ